MNRQTLLEDLSKEEELITRLNVIISQINTLNSEYGSFEESETDSLRLAYHELIAMRDSHHKSKKGIRILLGYDYGKGGTE